MTAARRPESQEQILLAALPDAELAELLAAPPRPAPPAGNGPRYGIGRMAGFASGAGAGFAEGGPLDGLAAGVPLAGFADDAHARLAALTDDELVGVLRAWRRQASWAQARELAAVAELAAAVPPTAARPRPRRVRFPPS